MLEVELIFTHDFSYENAVTVRDYLNQVDDGSIKFTVPISQPIDFTEPISLYGLRTWDEIFNLTGQFRRRFGGRKRKLVVLLSGIGNTDAWISKHRDDDIYIHTNEWDRLVDNHINPLLPICHQVAENVLQVLMSINSKDDESKYYHEDGETCLNFNAKHKDKFLAKVKLADICSTCMERVGEMLDSTVQSQLISILELVRLEFLSRNKERIQRDFNIEVTRKLEIFINGIRINFQPLEKAVYIFFLIKTEGIILSKVSKDENLGLIKKLYKAIDPNLYDNDNILDEEFAGNRFNKIRSTLHGRIAEKFGSHVKVKDLLISGKRGGAFCIDIPREKVGLPSELKGLFR